MAEKKKTGAKASRKRKESGPNVLSVKRSGEKTAANKRRMTRAERERYKSTLLKREIIYISVTVICLILLICLLGVGETFGEMVRAFMYGSFGVSAILLPFLLWYLVKNALEAHAFSYKIRLIGSVLILFTILCCLLEMIFSGDNPATLSQAYEQSANDIWCGGVWGLMFTRVLRGFFGDIITYLLLLALAVIFGIIYTRRSFVEPLKESSEKVFSAAVEKSKELSQKTKERRRQAKSVDTNREFDFEGTDLSAEGEPRQEEAAELPTEKEEPKVLRRQRKAEHIQTEKEETKESKASGISSFTITNNMDPLDDETHEEISPKVSVPSKSAESLMEEEKKKGKEQPAKASKTTPKEQHAFDQKVLSEQAKNKEKISNYQFPPLNLLEKGSGKRSGVNEKALKETAMKLQDTLESFGVEVNVTNASCGPTVTRYELEPAPGVKVSRITNLSDDIKLNLAVADIRIEAPIPGKSAVGIEVPNSSNSAVYLRDLLDTQDFDSAKSRLSFAVGKDIAGKPVITDIGKMPHLLIAGATGSGKSVCINTLIMSILYKARPDEVKLIMIDPKVVELSVYNGIPHLLIPVVTDPKKAAASLNWAVSEMTQRYNKFAQYGVRDMKGYNNKLEEINAAKAEDEKKEDKMPQIVIIVDELADLMMVASKEVEDSICRLAQLARAAGIHLIIATQRPSVNVITGLIKANMPSRIAFAVSSGVDSRTILDMNGAEKLLGKGDMLFYPQGYPKPARLQGSFVSDKEVSDVVAFLKENHGDEQQYDESIVEKISDTSQGTAINSNSESQRDALFAEAGRLIIEKEKASIGNLQRMYKIGFNRAARIMDQLCEYGVVSGEEGTKARKILMTADEFEELLKTLQ